MIKRSVQIGFTTVELLIAIGLFGVVAPSISLAIVSIGRVNDRAADLSYASVIAENKIEGLRSAGYNTLNDGTTDFTSELPSTFTAPRSASYTISSPSTGIKKLVLNIQYTDQEISRDLNYTSLIGELGVSQ